MKYFARSVKYFFSLIIIIAVMLGILVAIGSAEANIETMFRDGYNSLWQIALLFVVVSAIYPKFGYISRDALFAASWDEAKNGIAGYMEERGFVLAREEEGKMIFHQRRAIIRVMRMYEDVITITAAPAGVSVEGPRKDALRLAAGIENMFAK